MTNRTHCGVPCSYIQMVQRPKHSAPLYCTQHGRFLDLSGASSTTILNLLSASLLIRRYDKSYGSNLTVRQHAATYRQGDNRDSLLCISAVVQTLRFINPLKAEVSNSARVPICQKLKT